MTHATALLRQTAKPHIADMAAAIHADAAALSAEWSRGCELSMISAKSTATENTARILLLACAAALNDAGDGAMAGLIETYIRGRVAEMQFAHRDEFTRDALEIAASDLGCMAEEIAARFNEDAGRVAA